MWCITFVCKYDMNVSETRKYLPDQVLPLPSLLIFDMNELIA